MKRVITFAILVVMMLSVLSICAFAAPALNEHEQKIYDAYVAAVKTKGGDEVKLNEEWINKGRNYMLKEDVDITAEQAEKILGYIDEAKDIAATATTASEAKGLGTEINKKIVALAEKAAAVVELKTIVAEEKVTFVDAKTNEVVAESSTTIKATGAENSVMPAVVLCVLVVLTAVGAVCVRKLEF